MKKRNGVSGKGQGLLPMIETDRNDESGKRRKKQRRSMSPLQASLALLVTILAVGILVATAQRFVLGQSIPPDVMEEPSRKLVAKERDLPLQDFPSLQYALRNSEITLLYFAAVSSIRILHQQKRKKIRDDLPSNPRNDIWFSLITFLGACCSRGVP